MYKYLFILFFIPVCLFAQEQVSDIKNYGVTAPTVTNRKIGFTTIDGIQYVLQQDDSLVIYKLENDTLVYHGSIKKLKGEEDNYYTISPNRSLFKIENGIYYRFYKNGLQVIDIKNAQLVDEYHIDPEDYPIAIPLEIFNRKYTFTVSLSSNLFKYVLDLDTREISKLVFPKERRVFIHKENKIATTESSGGIYFYDVDSKKDTLIHQAANGINYFSYSPQDSSFNFLDNNMTLWKIDKTQIVKNTNCVLPTNIIREMALNGDKAIVITETKDNAASVDSVIVYDYSTCTIDMAFKTEERESFAYNFEFITNEYAMKDVSIFGYYGTHPSDGPDEGLYYIINHKNNTAIPIKEISRIASFTPFVYNNALYSKGINTSFWSSHEYILKVDLATNAKSILSPYEPYEVNSLSLGYHDDDAMHLATNTYNEKPTLWSLKNDTTYAFINEFDFAFNLGVNYIDKLIPQDERLFFTCNHGLYSMFDDCRLEASFHNTEKLQEYNLRKPAAIYKNKIAFAEVSSQKIVFKILDSQLGKIDSLVLSAPNAKVLVGVGPFIFFYPNADGNKLQYLDLKSNKIFTNNTFSYINSSALITNGNSAIFDPYGDKVYFIDFEKNNFDPINIEVKAFKNVTAGYDGSYYIIDGSPNFDSCRIRLITKNKVISTIYNGPGRYSSSYIPANGNTNMIVLYNNGYFIVSNDLANTYLPEVSQNNSIGLVQAFKNKFILRLSKNSKNEYWLYEAFKPLVKLMDEPNQRLVFSSMNDSLAFFIVGDQNYSVIKYNLKTLEIINTEPINTDVKYSYFYDYFKLNDHQFLLSANSNLGYEPAILDVITDSIKLLVDINPGIPSSFPSNFIIYKNWVYFTAIVEDNSNQWFRMKNDISIPTVEQVTGSLSLSIYPSPTSQDIMIDKDLEEVTIFGANGQLLLNTKNYKTNQRISVSHLPNGMYYIIGSNKSNHYSGKLVVVH